MLTAGDNLKLAQDMVFSALLSAGGVMETTHSTGVQNAGHCHALTRIRRQIQRQKSVKIIDGVNKGIFRYENYAGV